MLVLLVTVMLVQLGLDKASSCCKSSCNADISEKSNAILWMCAFAFWMALNDWPDVKQLLNWMSGWFVGWMIIDSTLSTLLDAGLLCIQSHLAVCDCDAIEGKIVFLVVGMVLEHLKPNCCTNKLLWRHGSGPLMCLNKRRAVKFVCILIFVMILQLQVNVFFKLELHWWWWWSTVLHCIY